nr:RNA-binding protein 44 isoform X1 [Misgurnus anguillicaudatus]
MWLPVVVPYSFEHHLNIYDNRLNTAVYPKFPGNRTLNETVVSVNFLQACRGFCNDPPYAEDGRKFMLMRLLFELIRANHCLEITDPKLLGWYLSLPVEDRTLVQNEGGFMQFIQRHPALEVVRKFVYLKKQFRGNYSAYPTSMPSNHNKTKYQVEPSHCQTCGYSFMFGTKKCHRCGIHVLISEDKVYKSGNDEELELLPQNVREELNVPTSKNKITSHSCESPGEENLSAQAQCLSQLWEEVEQMKDIKHFKDPTAQANSSLDMELDMQSQARRINRIQNEQAQSYDESSEGASNYCDMSQENLSEYYSFSNTSLNQTEWSDDSQNTEASFNDSIMATKGSTESSSETTITSPEDSGDCSSCLSNSFELAHDSENHLEDLRERELVQQMEKKLQVGSSLKSTSSVQCGTTSASFFVNQIVDASGDFRACFTSTRATEVCQTLQTKASQNVATDTDSLPVSNKKNTHTMQTSTSDKSTITEVYMADLNVITEEFIKLKHMEKELKQLKDRKSRPSTGGDRCGNVCGCDCAQRVRRAELRLLGLQFVMCQQHCWRRYFTSPLGESAYQGTEALPDILAETLDALEKDYHEMKSQILAGTPLDDLKPLSVDSQKMLTMGTYFSPSSVLDAHLGSFDCLGSTSTNSHTLEENAEGMGGPLCQNTEDILDEPIGNGSNRARMEGLLNKQPGMSSVIKDLNVSEAWFDAEEELGSSNQNGNMEKPKEGRESINQKMEQKDTDENTFNQSSRVCVTCLPNDVSKQEILIWFEKYNATDVRIANFNKMRGAIVYLKSPEDAKAAVKNLNGCTFKGQSIYLQELRGPTSTNPKLSDQPQSTAKISKAEVDRPKTNGVHYDLSPRGLRCSVDRLTKVCDSPTASGTFVPQRCIGKGSFNTIMTRLSERHPDIDRQKIVDALLELREMNQGMLSGYTLSTIVDMTSKRLTKGFSSKCV